MILYVLFYLVLWATLKTVFHWSATHAKYFQKNKNKIKHKSLNLYPWVQRRISWYPSCWRRCEDFLTLWCFICMWRCFTSGSWPRWIKYWCCSIYHRFSYKMPACFEIDFLTLFFPHNNTITHIQYCGPYDERMPVQQSQSGLVID